MTQSIEKMRAALDAFERDGKVLFRDANHVLVALTVTSNPLWDFLREEYYPAPTPLECWANEYPDEYLNVYYASADEARRRVLPDATRVAVRMIEAPEQEDSECCAN